MNRKQPERPKRNSTGQRRFTPLPWVREYKHVAALKGQGNMAQSLAKISVQTDYVAEKNINLMNGFYGRNSLAISGRRFCCCTKPQGDGVKRLCPGLLCVGLSALVRVSVLTVDNNRLRGTGVLIRLRRVDATLRRPHGVTKLVTPPG